MSAGFSTYKWRKDSLLFDTLDIAQCAADSNTLVSPAKKDFTWVEHSLTGCQYQHPKHIQHITDTAVLGVLNHAIKPFDTSIDKPRKTKQQMGYIQHNCFRPCVFMWYICFSNHDL
jgi:hypothetical protein